MVENISLLPGDYDVRAREYSTPQPATPPPLRNRN